MQRRGNKYENEWRDSGSFSASLMELVELIVFGIEPWPPDSKASQPSIQYSIPPRISLRLTEWQYRTRYYILRGNIGAIDRNASFCSIRFNVHIGRIVDYKLTGRHCLELHKSKLNIDSIDRALSCHEINNVREGLCYLIDNDLSLDDIETLISSIACWF